MATVSGSISKRGTILPLFSLLVVGFSRKKTSTNLAPLFIDEPTKPKIIRPESNEQNIPDGSIIAQYLYMKKENLV